MIKIEVIKHQDVMGGVVTTNKWIHSVNVLTFEETTYYGITCLEVFMGYADDTSEPLYTPSYTGDQLSTIIDNDILINGD